MTEAISALGYIRVSTHMQNEGDHALKRQANTIRNLCADRGIRLIAIYDDTCSAVSDFSIERRPSLKEAVDWATREGACLMVTEPSRLFRNEGVAERWLKTINIQIYSARDNRVLTHEEIIDAVRSGQRVATSISEGTIKALEKKRANGARLGSKVDLTAANKASARARIQRSNDIVDAIARVILEDDAYRDLSNRAFADLLNRRGIVTGWGRMWTADGVKRQRKEARELIREWEELAQDDLPAAPLPRVVNKLEGYSVPVPRDDEQQLKSLPFYGMF